MNTRVHYENRLTVIDKLVAASPLMPAIYAVLLFIAILSPLTWSTSGYLMQVVIMLIPMSVVIAYCIASFVENIKD